MKFFGIAKLENDIMIYYKTPRKYIYQLKFQFRKEEYIYNIDPYPELKNEFCFLSDEHNIDVNIKMDYTRHVIEPHYKCELICLINPCADKNIDFNNFIESYNKYQPSVRRLISMDLYRIIFSNEFKELLNNKRIIFENSHCRKVFEQFKKDINKIIKGIV